MIFVAQNPHQVSGFDPYLFTHCKGSYMLSSIVYIREQAPVIKRGLLGVLLGPGLISGYIVAGAVSFLTSGHGTVLNDVFIKAFIGLGFYYVTSPVNWRIPVRLPILSTFSRIVPDEIVLPYSWFSWPLPAQQSYSTPLHPVSIQFPLLFKQCTHSIVRESPRWLSMQGRHEEALAVLQSLHGDASDPTFIVAREEAYQINRTLLSSVVSATALTLYRLFRAHSPSRSR